MRYNELMLRALTMAHAIHKRLSRSAWIALVLLLSFRAITHALSDISASGDGVSYMKNADFIGDHGILPPLSIQPNAYGWLLSWFRVNKDPASALQWIGKTQQFFDFAIVAFLCWLAVRFVGQSNKLLIPAWIIITLQPFTGLWSRTIYSEQSVTFFSFTGFLLLSMMVCNNRNKRIAQLGLVVAGAALGFASLLRSDVLVLNSVLLLGLAIYLAFFAGEWLAWRRTKLATLALAYIAIPLLMASYQYKSSGEFGIFNNSRQNEGYFAWVRTWPATPKEYATFAFFSGRDSWTPDSYPSKAFDDPEEKETFAKTMEEWKKHYLAPDEAIDKKFMALANNKTIRHPVKHYMLNPIQRIYYFWINNDGAQFYAVPFNMKRPVSTLIVAAVSLSKLLLVALFLTGCTSLCITIAPKNGPSPLKNWSYFFSSIACFYVILRTLELGILSAWMIAGLMELRFISIAMPFMLVGALLGTRWIASRSKQLHLPARSEPTGAGTAGGR